MVDHLTSIIPLCLGVVLLLVAIGFQSSSSFTLIVGLGVVCLVYGIAIHSNNVRLLRRMERYTRSCAVVDY